MTNKFPQKTAIALISRLSALKRIVGIHILMTSLRGQHNNFGSWSGSSLLVEPVTSLPPSTRPLWNLLLLSSMVASPRIIADNLKVFRRKSSLLSWVGTTLPMSQHFPFSSLTDLTLEESTSATALPSSLPSPQDTSQCSPQTPTTGRTWGTQSHTWSTPATLQGTSAAQSPTYFTI